MEGRDVLDDTREDARAVSIWRRRCSSSPRSRAYPLIQMVWMSLHNWSIIEPAKWVGFANFVKAWNDRPVLDLARLHAEIHRSTSRRS